MIVSLSDGEYRMSEYYGGNIIFSLRKEYNYFIAKISIFSALVWESNLEHY